MATYETQGTKYELTLSEWQAQTGKDEGSVVELPCGIEIDRENKRVIFTKE